MRSQLQRVEQALSDGQPRTLDEIAALTGDPPASVSARLRELRRLGRDVTRSYQGHRVWAYALRES